MRVADDGTFGARDLERFARCPGRCSGLLGLLCHHAGNDGREAFAQPDLLEQRILVGDA